MMKRIGFISDELNLHEPLTNIIKNFTNNDIIVETINRLSPELPSINKILALINLCDAVVFYIKNGSPNIYYEIGIAQASNKKIILLADSYNLIPFDLSHIKSIIFENNNLNKYDYEIYDSLFSNKDNYIYNNNDPYKSYFNNYNSEIRFRDLYAYNGIKRHRMFEEWFINLVKHINYFEVMESEFKTNKDVFDLLLWNSTNDPDLILLGNPIPVEFKTLNSMNMSTIESLLYKLKKQGLRSLILATTGVNRNTKYDISAKLKKDIGVNIISLDRDDLIDIETPKDLYYAIKKQILNIEYMG